MQAQLDSLYSQSTQDFEILVGDDGSTDNTPEILENAQAHGPQRLQIVSRERIGGAAKNFMRLLSVSSAPYVMFSDQDDVWLPWKVARMLATARAMEDQNPQAPLLVHSDLAVVDYALNPIAPSFFAYQRIDPRRNTFADVVLHNCVTGCATLVNRALVELVRNDDPHRVFMHDWWCSIAAAAFGRISHLPEASTLYRQHGANAIGAQSARNPALHFARRATQVALGGRLSRPIADAIRQARAFEDMHGSDLKVSDRAQLALLAHLLEQDWFTRRLLMIRHNLLKQGWLRNVATLLTI